MPSRDTIVRVARSCIDTPFHHQGRLVGQGLDCAGVVVAVASLLNYEFTDTTNYPRRPDGKLQERLDATALVPLPVGTHPLPGMVGLFWLSKIGVPHHVAIFSRHPSSGRQLVVGMIHALAPPGPKKVVEHVYTDYWAERLMKLYDYPGVH